VAFVVGAASIWKSRAINISVLYIKTGHPSVINFSHSATGSFRKISWLINADITGNYQVKQDSLVKEDEDDH
jgi:hypothetical protein